MFVLKMNNSGLYINKAENMVCHLNIVFFFTAFLKIIFACSYFDCKLACIVFVGLFTFVLVTLNYISCLLYKVFNADEYIHV